LVHESLVGTIIDHPLSKNWRGELSVYLLGVEIRVLAVWDEIVALLAKIHSCRLPQQNQSEAISILSFAVKKEFVRIHAIRYGAANEGEKMEHYGRAVGVCKEQLSGDILCNGNNEDQEQGQRDGLRRGKSPVDRIK
jgi:hypothetical protein